MDKSIPPPSKECHFPALSPRNCIKGLGPSPRPSPSSTDLRRGHTPHHMGGSTWGVGRKGTPTSSSLRVAMGGVADGVSIKRKILCSKKKNGQSALFHRMITSTRGGGGGGGKERPTPPLLSPSRPPSSSSSRPPCSWRAPPQPPQPRTPPRLLGETRVSKLEWFFFLDNLRETLFSLLS